MPLTITACCTRLPPLPVPVTLTCTQSLPQLLSLVSLRLSSPLCATPPPCLPPPPCSISFPQFSQACGCLSGECDSPVTQFSRLRFGTIYQFQGQSACLCRDPVVLSPPPFFFLHSVLNRHCLIVHFCTPSTPPTETCLTR